jgi:hypothetical protein
MSKVNRFEVFDGIISWLLGIFLVISAIPHLGNPYFFLGSVYAYQMIWPIIGQFVVMVLPILQLILAVCLIGRFFIDAVNFLALGCFLVFATVQTSAAVRGLDISCGCFGPDHETMVGWFSLSLVYGLLMLSLIRNTICLFSQPSVPCRKIERQS